MAQAPTPFEFPKRLPLVIVPENRDDTTAKDARLVNAYCEKTEHGEYWLYSRPGFLAHSQPSGGAAAGQGVYNWRGDIYAVSGTALYKNGVSVGTVDATGGVYRFSQCLGATQKLFLDNTVKAYVYDPAGGLVEVTDVDFPTGRVKGSAYLNTTTYVATTVAGVYGSDFNAPSVWDPLNVLIAQVEPDGAKGLAKQLVYVVVLKEWSTELFYDAANATGSPLGPVQGAKVNWGCVSGDGVQDIDGALFWPARNRNSGTEVIMLEGAKAQPISSKPIERLLDRGDFSTTYSWTLKIDGHRFYVLTLKNSNLTLAYDVGEKMWSQWTDENGNYLPIVASTYGALGEHLLQHESNGRLYLCSSSYPNDNGVLITADIYTPNFDAGTKNKKVMSKLRFIADRTPGSILQVRHNDHDYDPKRWSNMETVDLSKEDAALTDQGMFLRRAHHLRHRCNVRLRIQAVEPRMLLGSL